MEQVEVSRDAQCACERSEEGRGEQCTKQRGADEVSCDPREFVQVASEDEGSAEVEAGYCQGAREQSNCEAYAGDAADQNKSILRWSRAVHQ